MLKACKNWICPVCKQSLSLVDSTWSCAANHSFDKAKEGYVNLLLAQHKKSKEPGDNKDMMLARHAFLSSNAYAPLAEALAQISLSYLNDSASRKTDSFSMLDIGCSEGYYSSYVQSTYAHHVESFDKLRPLQVMGVDISKTAIQKAAKLRGKGGDSNHYAVASSFNLPMPDDSVDIALQVFAPSSVQEVARVLSPKGIWITVEPASAHLQELKSFVYDSVKAHEAKEVVTPLFTLKEQKLVSFTVSLDEPDIRLQLLKMTPYYWKVSQENKERLTKELTLISTDFLIKVYCKSADNLDLGRATNR